MYSKEHLFYLKKERKKNIFILSMQILIFIIFILLWELLSRKGIINSFIYSSPSKVISTIFDQFKNGNLIHHLLITLFEIFSSFIIGSIIGFIISTILWWNNTLQKIIDPYLTILNSIPKIALGPIIIIWIGANQKAIITMALLISTIICIMNFYNYFSKVDPLKIKLMKSLKASKFQIFFKLVIPCNKTNIISTLKINISMTLIGVIMGEFLTSKAGIGYLIMYGSQIFNLNIVMSGTIILSIIATILYYLINYIEKRG